jgi:hypothetical protein
MARSFTAAVAGIGDFVFRQRTIRDQLRIEAEGRRILGGPTSDGALEAWAYQLASLTVLTETAPEGWDLDGLDPLDPLDIDKIARVHAALKLEEGRFRRGAGP